MDMYAANDAFFPLILYLMAMTEERDMIEQVRQKVIDGPHWAPRDWRFSLITKI